MKKICMSTAQKMTTINVHTFLSPFWWHQCSEREDMKDRERVRERDWVKDNIKIEMKMNLQRGSVRKAHKKKNRRRI